MKPFTLEVITQEKHLLTETVTSLSLNTQSGEITVLADHIPLFSRLVPGEMRFTANTVEHNFAITGGFVDVSPRNVVTVLADSAIRSEEINLKEAQIAVENAKKALEQAPDKKASLKIEFELRNALLKTKIAQRRSSSVN